MQINEFYEKVIKHNIELIDFHCLLVILAVQSGKMSKLESTLPKFQKITSKLKEEGIIHKDIDGYKLNTLNYNKSKYSTYLENKEVGFEDFFKSFSSFWRGKLGKISNGVKYTVFDRGVARREMSIFLEANPEIPKTVILKATKEFMEGLEVDAQGHYMYCPKCSNFIKGADKNAYLIEYCYNVINRGKAQTNIKQVSSSNLGYHADL